MVIGHKVLLIGVSPSGQCRDAYLYQCMQECHSIYLGISIIFMIIRNFINSYP